MNNSNKLKGVLIFTLMCLFSNAQNLKVMTYNIRLDVAVDGENDWAHRKEYFTSQIQFYEPDIFGIQEAKPNQVIDISSFLAQYSNVGIGREGIEKGESSNIYYKKDRFNVVESNTFWLSEAPNQISKGWDAAFNRVCTYALFKDKKTKSFFWVFNTHLDHIGEVARTKGIQLILSKIELLNSKKYPVIFIGDFNSEPNTERIIELKKVMDDSRDISKEKPFGPSGTFNNFKHNEAVTKLIDYIFISKKSNIEVKKYAVLSDSKDLKYPSDHLPVYVEINLNN
ncbi:MAG: endonuclease/exonuclease/phosphatase family protein [Lentimicrobium sp.]|nr:endonuclease/exonuclease/phosphatase family protein [Lentimicrobium sp.]